MKKLFKITVILFFAGMTVFAQSDDMSFYTEEINRTGATVFDLLSILEVVRDENLTGIGDFYHNALKTLFIRLPETETNHEKLAIQDCARIILRGLASEKYASAGPQVWALIEYFDVVQQYNDGFLMNEALIAMGLMGAKDYVPHIAARLDNFNAEQTADSHNRRKIQLGVVGAISALEALQEPEGVRPVFFASIGWYDPEIRAIASAAFPNIIEDPKEIICEIIQNPFNDPMVKDAAWQEMLRSKAPDSSKAKVAVTALETSYTYVTPFVEYQKYLNNMRASAVNTIRKTGVEDDSVYAFLERTYRDSYNNAHPDFEVIMSVVSTLSAVRTNESVELLTDFLGEINTRKRSGLWRNMERDIMQIIIPAIAVTGTQSMETMRLLSAIQHSPAYTGAEQNWAGSALRLLVK